MVTPDGVTQEWIRNSAGLPTTQIDGMGERTTFAYNSVGLVTSAQDPLGNTTLYAYDLTSPNRLTTVTDPLTHTTTFTYDFTTGATCAPKPTP